MPNCKEFVLDDVMAITAIPIANISASDPQSIPNANTPVLVFSVFPASALNGSITIGLQPAAPVGALIPIIRKSGKAQSDESDSVAGRLHTVNVTCEVDDRNPLVWYNLLDLERTPSHLLLTFRDGQRAFVSATEDTYLCRVERDGAKTSVAFKIQNLMGIQLFT